MRGGALADGGPAGGRVDPETRRLAIVFGLPLLDGVFVSLVLAGMLDTLAGIVVMGVLVFGGTATVAVILADCGRNARRDLSRLVLIGAVAVPVAGLQAMLAPTIASLVDPAMLARFAAVVLVILAASIARPALGDWLPSPWILIGCGFVASVQPAGIGAGVVAVSTTLFVHGALAVLLGLVVACGVAVAGARLRRHLDPSRLRLGAGASLVVVAVSLLTGIPMAAALLVLVGSVAVAAAGEADGPFPPVGSTRSAPTGD